MSMNGILSASNIAVGNGSPYRNASQTYRGRQSDVRVPTRSQLSLLRLRVDTRLQNCVVCCALRVIGCIMSDARQAEQEYPQMWWLPAKG